MKISVLFICLIFSNIVMAENSLEGTSWVKDCFYIPFDQVSYKTKLEFKKRGKVRLQYQAFKGENCEGEEVSTEIEGDYVQNADRKELEMNLTKSSGVACLLNQKNKDICIGLSAKKILDQTERNNPFKSISYDRVTASRQEKLVLDNDEDFVLIRQ